MWNQGVTIAEGYTIMGIESLKNNIAYLLHMYAGQISIEDIAYVNEDMKTGFIIWMLQWLHKVFIKRLMPWLKQEDT